MIPYFQYTVFHLGPLPLQVWGFFVALGMGVSLYILQWNAKKNRMTSELFLDAAMWMIVGGLIGARLFHVVFYEPQYFLAQPIDVIKIWQGGLSSFGGLVGALMSFLLVHVKQKKDRLPVLVFADYLSFAALFGWIIGRIGCFMIHDHLGVKSTLFFALQTPDGPRLEMAFLEILGLLPLVLVFWLVRNKTKKTGWYTSVLFFYYGILRFILDFFRAADIEQADVRLFGLTPGQYFAILLTLFSLFIWWRHTED